MAQASVDEITKYLDEKSLSGETKIKVDAQFVYIKTQESTVSYSMYIWKKFVELAPTLTEALENREEISIQIYKQKYARVIHNMSYGWVVSIILVDQYGKTLYKYCAQFREDEWEELCSLFGWVESKHEEMNMLKKEQKASAKALKEQQKSQKKKSLLYMWQCGETKSLDYFFSQEDARNNALRDPEIEAQQENLQVTAVHVDQPFEVSGFLKFAYSYIWAQEFIKYEKDIKEAGLQGTSEATLEEMVVSKEVMSTMFLHFFLAQGLPCEDFQTEWVNLHNYSSKEELKNVAVKMIESEVEGTGSLDVFSPFYTFCKQIYKDLLEGKLVVT